MCVLEKGQSTGKVCVCLRVELGSGGPGCEAVDLVLDLRNQRVRSAGETDGPDVVGYGWLL